MTFIDTHVCSIRYLLSSKNQSSKQWLDYHGLAAKRLTILDALSPTFIPHKPKYIPILDKHVLSKVFDDVSLYQYVSFISVKQP